MSNKRFEILNNFAAVLALFLIVSLLMTYNVLPFQSLVIGDNVFWTRQNIVDILGLDIIRESFLGDIALLSTFKAGFLFPLAYTFSVLKLPFTLIYPFLFYVLSMLSFYALSVEILRSRVMRSTLSILYVINPVTPYYFASILFVFALVFLPLAMKFFIRTLRDLDQASSPRSFLGNFALSAAFLALSVSAHEQFFLSTALLAMFMMSTLVVFGYQRYGRTWNLGRLLLTNIISFMLVFLIVNAPLFLSLNNITNAPLSTYFTGRFNDFLANVRYTYANANALTLLRLGGDSGVGLGQESWYDSSAYTNVLGYSIFALFAISVLLLSVDKKARKADKAFFYFNVLIFLSSILLILFIGTLPNNPSFARLIFDFLLQTWQSPIKLRVLLLLASLTTILFTVKKLEADGRTRRKKILQTAFVLVLIGSVVVYNSPWLIGYAGYTPMQQVSDSLKWGSLFDDRYSQLIDLLEENYTDGRGLIIPYTPKGQLYVPPNFRLFQLVSVVNDQTARLTQGDTIPWSKVLGLLSAKYIVLDKRFSFDEEPIFPRTSGNNITKVFEEMENDSDFESKEQFGGYTILDNKIALPKLYASGYFVFFDDTGTLRYALQEIDLAKLPVFIGSVGQINEFNIPEFISNDVYEVKALAPESYGSASNLTLVAANGRNLRELGLNRVQNTTGLPLFSAPLRLYPGDVVKVPNSESWDNTMQLNELVLDSSSRSLGNYDSFMLNFTVSLLRPGQYSFLGPRVLIDVGDNGIYYLVFHDNGFFELALLKGETLTSGIMTSYCGYSLRRESDSINVSVTRIFDEIQVYINDNLAAIFPIGASASTISLSSEHSVSKFFNISVQTRNILRLFATRQLTTQPVFSVQQDDPNKSVLTVSNDGSQFAVVSQYLNTRLRELETQPSNLRKNNVEANIFFQAWILNATGSDSRELTITIDISNSTATLGLTLFSITFTYLILIAQIPPIKRRMLKLLRRLLYELEGRVNRGQAENNEKPARSRKLMTVP